MVSKIEFANDWDELLKLEIQKPYFIKLMTFLKTEYKHFLIYPKFENLFTALKMTSYHETKVVVIGQDPYHQPNQSHGLAFSVIKGNKIPKSLHNIFLELVDDEKIDYPSHGNLDSWARQGVLLLNNVLTVRDNEPNSHRHKGWEQFTAKIIKLLNQKNEAVVYLLWGKSAQKKIPLITNDNHKILTAPHPSPLSAFRGFFGCKHFSKTNQILVQNNLIPINWQI